jgi:hypothetical protein
LECGDLSPLFSFIFRPKQQQAAKESGDKSPHSKVCGFLSSLRRLPEAFLLAWFFLSQPFLLYKNTALHRNAKVAGTFCAEQHFCTKSPHLD